MNTYILSKKNASYIASLLLGAVLFCMLASSAPVSAQSSDITECTNQVYLSQSDEISFASSLQKLDLSVNPFTLTTIASPSSDFWNALGYRFDDGYFYATTPDNANSSSGGTPGEVFRINANGAATSLGTPISSSGGDTRYFAGDVRSSALPSGDGYYYVLDMDDANASDNDVTQFFRIDVSGGTASLEDTVNITGITDVRLNDWAFNPKDGQLYGFEQHRQRFIKVNPDSGAASFVGPAQPTLGTVHGAAWFDAQGKFYSYHNGIGNPSGNLYLVNTTTGSAEEINPGGAPSVARNDGAACPFAPMIEKTASPTTVAQNGTTTYTYEITNVLEDTALVADFVDVLEDGRTYVANSLSHSQVGGTPNSYGGTNTLRIESVSIPANATVTITVRVKIPRNLAPGTYYNQACLEDFAIATFGEICSDYPITTDIIGDPTPIEVVAAASPKVPGVPNTGLSSAASNPLAMIAAVGSLSTMTGLIVRWHRKKLITR